MPKEAKTPDWRVQKLVRMDTIEYGIVCESILKGLTRDERGLPIKNESDTVRAIIREWGKMKGIKGMLPVNSE